MFVVDIHSIDYILYVYSYTASYAPIIMYGLGIFVVVYYHVGHLYMGIYISTNFKT